MYHAITAGKAALKTLKKLNRTGSTWPGHIALKVDTRFIRESLAKNPELKVVLIAGTNGKTTTTKALSLILEENGISVLTNQAGANLLNGLASLLISHISLSGKLNHKALIFEVDENSLPQVLKEIQNPDAVILLNLFRDQLDRYGEVNTTAETWEKSLMNLSSKTLIVANADDPLIASIANKLMSVVFFSIEDKYKTHKKFDHAVDSITCPNCRNPLFFSKISYSHLGNYKCTSCTFESPEAQSYTVKSNLKGVYNLYNLSATILCAEKIFNISPASSIKNLQSLTPAFGRQELVEIDGKRVMYLLSKNPTGFNVSLNVAIDNKSSSLLILLNDRIPDGRDISWIWDVDFKILKKLNARIFVSGDRSYDIANRLFFAGISYSVFEKFDKAFEQALNATQKGETLTILPTYSAMLDIRKHISGKKIL